MMEDRDDGWISNCVDEAYKAHPSVSDSSVTSIRELMKRKVLNQQLSPVELESIVTSLLANIALKNLPKADLSDAD